MLFRRSHLSFIAASAMVFACSDAPTTPSTLMESDAAVASARGGVPGRPDVDLTGQINQTIAGNAIAGVVNITRFAQAPDGGLLASGTITGTANGTAFTQAFTDLPVALTSGAAGAASDEVGTMSHTEGGCGILFLDLAPLHLDVLGLTVDLAQVVLDISAVPGAGNLLGNLLCAVVGLFDGLGFLTQLTMLLDRINDILGAL